MNEFVDYLREAFSEFGPVTARKMFGGHGIFYNGLMIGLVADGMLYLKVDSQTRSRFADRGLPQFEYTKGSRTVAMSYCLAPEESLESPAEMSVWARFAYEAALRSRKQVRSPS